jgi:excinuclease UvrABC nuclease subunit
MIKTMAQIPEILDRRLDFDPEGDFEKFLEQAPAKWVVYLLADASGEPVQLLCVKNLRQSLKRRLAGNEALVLSKRVEYRQIVRQIYFRRVDSALEADWVYHDVARQIFPNTYQGMTGFRPAWFIHVDPETDFPRYGKTTDLGRTTGVYLGPFEDKHAAAKIIELVEDWFDLCRYYQILIQAPRGRACAYKEMGKCPAPCDGSISMDQYRIVMDWSARVLADPGEFLRDQEQRMRDAAADLRFETAGKIKTFADQVAQLGKGPWRHLRRLRDFAFVSLQPGPTPRRAKVFLIVGGRIEEIADLIGEPRHPADLLRTILAAAEYRPARPPDALATERIGIVTHHLFSSRQTQGVFIPLADLAESSFSKAWRDLSKQKQPEETEGEGVQKELQAM